MKLLSVLCILSVLVGKVYYVGSDGSVFEQTLDQVYSPEIFDWLRESEFISRIWLTISKSIPESVKLPSFRETLSPQDYLRADETEIHIRVGGIVQIDMDIDTDMDYETDTNYRAAAVDATLTFTQPLSFQIYKTDTIQTSSASNKKTAAEFSFGQKNKVNLLLRIPRLKTLKRNQIREECLIYIDSVTIEELSKPAIDEANKIVKQFWNSVKKADIYEMMRFSIMTALSDQLEQLYHGKGWVCASEYFKAGLYHDVDGGSDDQSGTGITKENGKFIYNKIDNSIYMKSIQFGIERSLDTLAPKSSKEIPKDFETMTTVQLKTASVGLGRMDEFTFITYAPDVFRRLRQRFGVEENTYKNKLCKQYLKELVNPGKSGSGLYLSQDEYFIAKTVQSSEADVLKKVLLPKYFDNMQLNQFTLLPKFFGLYWYKNSILNPGVSLRLIVMNNLMPVGVDIHQKYDLKGSLYRRKAIDRGGLKPPTFKDKNFLHNHPKGIFLEQKYYNKLMESIKMDSGVLQNSKIIDFSLLLGLHYKNGLTTEKRNEQSVAQDGSVPCELQTQTTSKPTTGEEDTAQVGIPAKTVTGEPLVLYAGIIDTLQDYRFIKKLEHLWKYVFLRGEVFSVVGPTYYTTRFIKFMLGKVFKQMPPCPKDVDIQNPRLKTE